MSSSDSEDDCYGNIAQKLQTIKSRYEEEKVECVVLNDNSEGAKTSEKLSKPDYNSSEIVVEDCNVTVNSTDNEEFTLDAIIANNSKTIGKRGRGRGRGAKRNISDISEPSERTTRASRRKTANSLGGRTSPIADIPVNVPPVEKENTQDASTIANSRRQSGSTRGRGSRGRCRATNPSPRGRGRGRRRNLTPFELCASIFASYPTYSVGNTDEYPDQSDNQQLFAPSTVNNDIQIIEEVDPLEDENEEMSVKVYWQNLEIFKFKIRKYQKLTQIFDYFTAKENVSNDKLLFTYNDRILKIDDTPDSINYSIAKFIDGGIVNQNVTKLVKENGRNNVDSGLKIKFQCQNKKKPFETTVRPDEKFMLAMTKCAEHLETPLERLKFYFDGDLLSSKNTPLDLELEGGECIDVKICS